MDDYLKLMKNTVGYTMDKEEINQLYIYFKQKEENEDIIKQIKYQSEILLSRLNNKGCEISKWALTYLLDDEDLIHDELTFLGYQDDALILNAAIKLLKMNHNISADV